MDFCIGGLKGKRGFLYSVVSYIVGAHLGFCIGVLKGKRVFLNSMVQI